MIQARFSPKAARDLDEISGYIATDNPEAAEQVRRTIFNTGILTNPKLHNASGCIWCETNY